MGWDDCGGEPGDKLLVKDTIADITLQQVLTRPSDFDVIATTNLNGDYLSDALAAQVGGIGIAPGGQHQLRDRPRHLRGDARHRAQVRRPGQGEPRLGACSRACSCSSTSAGPTRPPTSCTALEATIADKVVTYDFARLMEGATEVKCSEFAAAIVDRL